MRRDHEAAFGAFVDEAGGRLLRFARLLVLDHGHAEDALQEALVRLARHWERTSYPEAYVRRILVNLAKDRSRRRHLDAPPTDRSGDARAADHADAVAARRVLDDALGALPPKQRVTVVLRVLEDLSEAETAELMGCATGTVKSNLSRGLATRRGRLGAPQEAGR